jgi:predicted extracellular nuclease
MNLAPPLVLAGLAVTLGLVADAGELPDATLADVASHVTSISASVCLAPDTPIGVIQGAGAATALSGETVTVQGVVVGDYEYPGSGPTHDHLRGFFVQNPAGSDDGDPATSDAIFVFNFDNDNVSLGQVVQVTGTVSEFDPTGTGVTLTELTATSIELCTSIAVIDATPVRLPLASATDLERYEGMLVSLPQTLTVTEHFHLGRFGQVLVSAGARLSQPTSVSPPGAPALALQAHNELNRILLDDHLQAQNPDPIAFGRSGRALSASNTLRGGDTVRGVVGVLTHTDATSDPWVPAITDPMAYRVRPINALHGTLPGFLPANPRPAPTAVVPGRLKVAAFNLLNYYNTFGIAACTNGIGGSATDCRGADGVAEFDRQWPKTVAAIIGTGADVIALSELENDGYAGTSAIQDLVDKLNAATAPGSYAFVDADRRTGVVNALGVDAIRVGLLYKPAKVEPVGQTAALRTGAFGIFTISSAPGTAQRNRPALAQAFEEVANGGARFIVVANHLKSKGRPCDDNLAPVGPDPDARDGQGNCNLTRTQAARDLATWLAADPTGTGDPDVLIVGDLNAYARETPVTTLTAAGYVDLIQWSGGALSYSYVFDGQWGYLDHALASPSLAAQVGGALGWQINADEPNVLDYRTSFKSAGQAVSLYAAGVYRASDHDPTVVGLDLSRPDEAGKASRQDASASTTCRASCVIRRPIGWEAQSLVR